MYRIQHTEDKELTKYPITFKFIANHETPISKHKIRTNDIKQARKLCTIHSHYGQYEMRYQS